MLNTNEKMKACHLNIVFPLIAAGVLQVEFDIFFFKKRDGTCLVDQKMRRN